MQSETDRVSGITLVDGDHLLVGDYVVGVLRHVPHIAADDQRRLKAYNAVSRATHI
jgi:hypothetical protein